MDAFIEPQLHLTGALAKKKFSSVKNLTARCIISGP